MSEKSTCVAESDTSSRPSYSEDESDDESDDIDDLPSTPQSNLVTRVLMNTTSGSSSYHSAQGHGYAAYLDGLRHWEVTMLAACGDWGSVPGNVRRDIHTAFFKSLGYTQPEKIEVHVKHPGSNYNAFSHNVCVA